jgi:hypothetical protein
LERPWDLTENKAVTTSTKSNSRRGMRSNECRLRRIENRKMRRIESRRVYRGLKGMIPREEWGPARPIPQYNWASKAGGTNCTYNETRNKISWKKHWYSHNEPIKYYKDTRGTAPKWEYSKEIRVASLNVRGMKEISKREQVVTYMKHNSIDLLCVQETKIPSSSIEQRGNYVFVFSSSVEGGNDHHGVGFCYSRKIEKYRNHYVQHSSHLAEIEVNMHGNPLVILTAYMPHDASDETNRLAAWEEVSNRVGEI